ncbi:MAG: hypothetical protein JSR82_03705 [Verrucomicrobia bacterium]|nr:hypothetical protein [Verrucomicrobiota bacterium]
MVTRSLFIALLVAGCGSGLELARAQVWTGLPGPAATPPPAASTPSGGGSTAEFMARYLAAAGRYRLRDYEGAVAFLEQAEWLRPQQADVSDFRGLIAQRQRDFNEAERWYKRALRQNPNLWSARFHYADLPFAYKNYAAARGRYEALLTQLDPRAQARERELVQFKIFLTHLLQGRVATARAYAQKFAGNPRSPAKPYVDAALAFYLGETAKGRALLLRQLQTPTEPDQVTASYLGTMARVGWIPESPRWDLPPLVTR